MGRFYASADRISGILLFLVGGAAIYGAVRLEIGTLGQPEPGLFPFLAGLAVLILAVLLLIQDARREPSDAEPAPRMRSALMAIGGLAAFVLSLDLLGYVVATALLVAILLFVFEIRRMWVYALAAPLIAIGSYVLFHVLLNLPLPAGALGF